MELFESNINYVEAGVLALKKYLLSKELFWPIHLPASVGQAPYPKLTLGNLLFYLQRTKATAQTPAQEAQFSKVEDEIQVISYKWRSAWEEKAEKEYASRLRQWQNFLNESLKGEASPANFAPEIKLRALLELLSGELSENKEKQLQVFDQVLKAKFVMGDFIWEKEYAAGFPNDRFWFLYGDIQ